MTTDQGVRSITVAVSTLGSNLRSLEKLFGDLVTQTRTDFEVLLIVQEVQEDRVSAVWNLLQRFVSELEVRVFFSWERGLLKSRNIALLEADGRAVWFSDDDCRYYEDSVEKVAAAFDRCSDSDIITFNSETEFGGNRNDSRKKNNRFAHNLFTIFSVCSIEVAVRVENRKKDRVRLFDERFGLGTRYVTGGENIMLTDCLRGGYRVWHEPVGVVCHPRKVWPDDKDVMGRLAFSKGAMFKRIFGWSGIFVMGAFVCRQYFSKGPLREMYRYWRVALKGFLEAPV